MSWTITMPVWVFWVLMAFVGIGVGEVLDFIRKRL